MAAKLHIKIRTNDNLLFFSLFLLTFCANIHTFGGNDVTDVLQILLVCIVEGGEFAAVDVEDGNNLVGGGEERHHDFGARETAAGYVAWELFYVGNYDGALLFPRCATDTASVGYVHTRHRTLEGS